MVINGGVQGAGTTVTAVNSTNIAPSNDITLNGRASLTFTTASSAINSLTFNNNGGEGNPTVTLTAGTLTLGSANGIVATSSNAATTSTLTGGTVVLPAGANTFAIAPIAIGGQVYAPNQATLSIASVISGAGSAITKSGNGLLQLSAANTFSGGMTVSGGGLIIAGGGTGVSAGTGANAVTGPVGAGSLTMAAGTRLLVDGTARTLFNPVTLQDVSPVFGATVLTATTLTLNGPLTPALTSGALAVNVENPFLTLVYGGQLTNAASVTTISKTGLGNYSVNLTGMSGLTTAPFAQGGTVGLLADGDGDMQPDLLATGLTVVTDATAPAFVIGRAGGTATWNQAINKVIAPAAFTAQLGTGITVTNNNQYQLRVADNIALSATVFDAAPVFSVATASNSNTLAGLRLDGVISGGRTGSTNAVLTKSGAGTLELTNAANTFGGTGSMLDVAAGILAVPSNEALGDSANVVRLSANSGTQGFRATGTFTTARTFNLNAATVGIDVVPGATLTLSSAFGGAAGNALQKNDLGTLVLAADNTGRTGATNVSAGLVQPAHNRAFGDATAQVNINATTMAAAVQLAGGRNISNPLNVNSSATNVTLGGINFGGQLANTGGTNTWSVPSLCRPTPLSALPPACLT